MFDGRELYEAGRLIDEWRSIIEKRAGLARVLSARLARLSETARSPDGLVAVTVTAGGDLTGLDLGEGIRRRPAAVTAREIVATLRAARLAMVAAVTAATTEAVGADSATGRAVIETYAARLLPDGGDGGGGGQILPRGNGQILPRGDGEIFPRVNGRILPRGDGEIVPCDNGRTLSRGDGEIFPRDNGRIFPDDNRQVFPDSGGR